MKSCVFGKRYAFWRHDTTEHKTRQHNTTRHGATTSSLFPPTAALLLLIDRRTKTLIVFSARARAATLNASNHPWCTLPHTHPSRPHIGGGEGRDWQTGEEKLRY